MEYPLVSIIITTRNSGNTLGDLLDSIKKQTYRYFEIILVDNFSSDKTMETARKYTNLIFQKGPERSAQRNLGVKKCHGKYILILDSDMLLSKNILKECVEKCECHNTNNIKIGGLIIPEKSFGKGCWAKAKILEREINQGRDYFEAARFFPKTVFSKVGGYDIKLTGPEDWDLPKRIQKRYQIDRIKNYIYHNEGRPTLLGLAKRKYYYGLSVHQYLTKQQISAVSPVTIYFLRPAFYAHLKKMIKNPLLSFNLIIMLFAETLGGGLGYLVGRFKNE